MPVYYSAVSRGRIVLCDYSTVKIQLEDFALKALELLGPSDEQRRQEIDGRLIFTLTIDKITFLAITDMDYGRVRTLCNQLFIIIIIIIIVLGRCIQVLGYCPFTVKISWTH